MHSTPLLQVSNLKKTFSARGSHPVHAVDDVSFHINKGETFGLVGESGSGKTTLGRTILRLTEPDSGKIHFRGEDITKVRMRPWRRKMQIIFQNPAGSLDPKMCVRDIICEGLFAGGFSGSRDQASSRVAELLQIVGLNADDMFRYPGSFSGGQQQRIGIARALAVDPEFIICDEPVSALDVSYQAQIINLLEDLKTQKHLTYLFISHDLSVVMHISDRIGVMFRGKIVELGSKEDILHRTAHPYTKDLLAAVPVPDISPDHVHSFVPLSVSSQPTVTGGCPYLSRCSRATEQCHAAVPGLKEISPGHLSSCLHSHHLE